MKTKFTITVLLGLLTLAFIFTNPAEKNVSTGETSILPPVPGGDDFIISSFNSAYDVNYEYDSLGFNIWHLYGHGNDIHASGRHIPPGWQGFWAPGDSLYAGYNDYVNQVKGTLSEIDTSHFRKAYLTRPKLEWFRYGQRSDYQCEYVSPVASPSNDLWFYAFNVVVGETIEDTEFNGGKKVLHCSSIESGPGGKIVVKRLRANSEQGLPYGDKAAYGDNECTWLIKPRIRIDSAFANNPVNFNTPVCSIIVKNQDGNIFKNVVLSVRHLKQHPDSVYHGNYKEEFSYQTGDSVLTYKGKWGQGLLFEARGTNSGDGFDKADIQVYWYDNCEMWIDYVRVDNDIADMLLNPLNEDYLMAQEWLLWEAEIANSSSAAYRYYLELIEFNNLPCITYVYHKLDSLTGGAVKLVATVTPHLYAAHVPWADRLDVWNTAHLKKHFLDKVGSVEFMLPSYPFTSSYGYPESYPDYPSTSEPTWSKIPNTLPRIDELGVLAIAENPADYDTWLQEYLDDDPYSFESDYSGNIRYTNEEDPGNFRYIMQLGDAISKETGMPFIFHTSAHSWYLGAGAVDAFFRSGVQARDVITGEVQREPTNEELDMITNISLTYGAKGLMWFEMASRDTIGHDFYSRGILNPYWEGGNNNNPPRYINAYGQQKWNKLKTITQRIKAWEPYIMSFDNANRHSYIYRDYTENSECLTNEYFTNILTYYRGEEQNQCLTDMPIDPLPPDGMVFDCLEETYLQVATFEKAQNDGNNYFMVVNRRCSPLQLDHNDGERYIRVKFDNSHMQLNGAKNWKVIDILTGWDTTFNKNSIYPVNLGWFSPGEGRLYKMVPIVKSGGTLVGDEDLSNIEFTCEAPVYNNGFDITVGANTTIHFTDSSMFVMDGGTFTVGNQMTSGSQSITSDAVSGNSWKGHMFTDCNVNIYGATFTGLTNDTTYAINIVDCPVVDIRNCTFNTNSSLKGGINAVFYEDPEVILSNIYIGGNTFNSSGSTLPTVNIASYAGETTPLIIENNTFTEGNTAIFLSGVTGGAVKGNSITDNFIGINALTSSIDVIDNTITSSLNGSMGIFSAAGSELRMNVAGFVTLGGLNYFTHTGTGTNSISVEGSYFLLDNGQNVFDITDDESSHHLFGYFPMFTMVSTSETNNCFLVDNTPVDPPYKNVTDGYMGSQITFDFTPFLIGCDPSEPSEYIVINLGGGMYDTIYTGGMGGGGGFGKRLPLVKGESPQGEGVLYTAPTAKQKYDSLSVLMRYRNYSEAKTRSLDLINTYPDSIQSLLAVSKLFLSTVASDTTYNAVSGLKTYYEYLILNNSSNTSLVKRANYFILKCKVRMHEYTQALAGFQQIINQNPYSYEGLIARWDYMATSLLVQGQGGGYSSIDEDPLVMSNYDIEGDDDKSPFTNEQRQDIRKSINTAIEISKNSDETKIKTLEVKSETGDVNASRELTQMKSLKQVVKTLKPRSITEHVRIVSEDIRKVFGTSSGSKGNEPKNIPSVFRISQNYPNPFNPTTKINYDLPKDSKVSIVIYDILGREVKRLVNNEIKSAGTYIVDFNAANYASGVYFYRIEAEEPNGNKFVDSKKMVLLK